MPQVSFASDTTGVTWAITASGDCSTILKNISGTGSGLTGDERTVTYDYADGYEAGSGAGTCTITAVASKDKYTSSDPQSCTITAKASTPAGPAPIFEPNIITSCHTASGPGGGPGSGNEMSVILYPTGSGTYIGDITGWTFTLEDGGGNQLQTPTVGAGVWSAGDAVQTTTTGGCATAAVFFKGSGPNGAFIIPIIYKHAWADSQMEDPCNCNGPGGGGPQD